MFKTGIDPFPIKKDARFVKCSKTSHIDTEIGKDQFVAFEISICAIITSVRVLEHVPIQTERSVSHRCMIVTRGWMWELT